VIRARDMLGFDLSPYPHVEAWLEDLLERPAVAQEAGVVAALAT
jgi:glutathione S-transferase